MEDKNAKENEVLEVKSKEFNNKFLFWVVMLVCFAWSIFQLFLRISSDKYDAG